MKNSLTMRFPTLPTVLQKSNVEFMIRAEFLLNNSTVLFNSNSTDADSRVLPCKEYPTYTLHHPLFIVFIALYHTR